ncbi:DNA-binding response OmpR family regulator [Peribacillus deserti]|uniref:DNA-binding response OmpR family regulator n=1 Tax=Peribacillus deserti TaxID=673318 RepID=A0ABS2QD85_9BACI|nr:response regulator transcription factor [Peribacillus deserti]MBM7691127.1 DNA-binding response OmpR family regulator [Peribacillus deserti]
MYKIMIVEDDSKISSILSSHLEKYGYTPVLPSNFKDIKKEFMLSSPHLVLLDVNLPYFDGYYWCRQIRMFSNIPIIFISARVGEMDQVMAIENGGDDYITKPFHLDVVMAKIKGTLRRAYGEYSMSNEQEVIQINDLYLYPSQHKAERNEYSVQLSRNEYILLESLVKRMNETVAREDLLEALWDNQAFVDDNTLTVNVKRVRSRLQEMGIKDAIQTKRGIGYSFSPEWRE